MAQNDPWAAFRTTPATSAPIQPRSGPSNSDPVLAPPDPYKQNAEARANRDQQLQEQAAQRAAAADARAAAAEARAQNKDQFGTESQSKDANFYGRMLQAEQNWSAINGDKIAPRGVVQQYIHDKAPNVENSFLSDNRQSADVAARNFIAATLRLESGAAIGQQEYDNQYRIFFPMPGDSEQTIQQKAVARQQAIKAMRLSAGPLADKAAQTVTPFNPNGSGDTLDEQRKKSIGLFGAEYYDQNGNPLGPQGGMAYDRNGNEIGLVGSVSDTSPESKAVQDAAAREGSGLTTLAQAGITAGLSDEAAGVGGAIAAYLTGQDPQSAYYVNRDAIRLAQRRAMANNPVLGPAVQFLGGMAGMGGNLVGAGAPTFKQIVGGSAAAGGLAGFGNGQGATDSVNQALLGAGGNALLGAGLYAAAPVVARGVNALVSRAPQADMAVVQAGERQGIPVRQPDARPNLRGQYAQAESGQTSGPLIRSARQADQAAIEARAAEVGGPGNAGQPYQLGKQVQAAGQRYIDKSKGVKDRFYARAESLAGGQRINPQNAIAEIDRNIAELQAQGGNANKATIDYLQGLKEDMSKPGGFSITEFQGLRTANRNKIKGDNALTASDADRRLGLIADEFTKDATAQLPPAASSALAKADKFYAKRQAFIKDTLQQFMGTKGKPLPAETAAARLVSMTRAKGDYDKFSAMWGKLTPDEKADVSATVAASLGRDGNGSFTLAKFINSLDPRQGISPDTVRMIFGDDGAKALADLRVLATAKKDAMDRLSPSGQAIGGRFAGLKTLLMTALGFSQGGPVGAVAGGMAQQFITKLGEQRAARMLLNPDFTKALRNAPNTTNPRVIDRYFARLGSIGSIAANDNAAFTNAIRSVIENSPGRAAAQGDQNTGQEPPQQRR